MPTLFGAKLSYLRRQRQISQIDVGRELSLVSSAFVSHLEANRKAPSVETVLGVANVFNVSIDYLTDDSIPIDPPIESELGPSPIPPQLLGAKLKYLRKKHGRTQAELIEKLGLRTQGHVSHVEASRHQASLTVVLNIAHVFQVALEYLLRDNVAVEAVIPKHRKAEPSA